MNINVRVVWCCWNRCPSSRVPGDDTDRNACRIASSPQKGPFKLQLKIRQDRGSSRRGCGRLLHRTWWHPVASWTWDAQDETCGICRMAFDGCCPDCKFPGDDCPLIWGACNHGFHLHCILKWVNSQTPQPHCPMCRREWQFKGFQFLGQWLGILESESSSVLPLHLHMRKERYFFNGWKWVAWLKSAVEMDLIENGFETVLISNLLEWFERNGSGFLLFLLR
ncbi:hypothetical protein MRB53_025759 [Persea americana]|uniref:Uncharacterized protein n=1 Tax=Persea americana TaxID=3435 RepID=A0ACC2LGG4_PERAE|nr:hypothetical protein MRB53_025759 [Persea americana]